MVLHLKSFSPLGFDHSSLLHLEITTASLCPPPQRTDTNDTRTPHENPTPLIASFSLHSLSTADFFGTRGVVVVTRSFLFGKLSESLFWWFFNYFVVFKLCSARYLVFFSFSIFLVLKSEQEWVNCYQTNFAPIIVNVPVLLRIFAVRFCSIAFFRFHFSSVFFTVENWPVTAIALIPKLSFFALIKEVVSTLNMGC